MQSDYFEQILKQCEEQQARIEKLDCENHALRSENHALREEVQNLCEKCNELERTLEERIEAAVSQAVEMATAPLYAEITARDNEIARLKAIIGKDSSNTSKPPSSNGLSNQVSNSRDVGGRAKT